ncbi:MAG TPA: hypothetical protein VMV69_17285 [Pirellulales bacterium]|nr:hypothetical protein [Pirellulales bacterium]
MTPPKTVPGGAGERREFSRLALLGGNESNFAPIRQTAWWISGWPRSLLKSEWYPCRFVDTKKLLDEDTWNIADYWSLSMLTIAGRLHSTRDFCDGVSRRDVLRIGTLAAMGTVGGWTLPDLLRAESLSGRKSPKSVIMIYLVGGPPHQDMFDLKPEAPKEIAGPWRPIATFRKFLLAAIAAANASSVIPKS